MGMHSYHLESRQFVYDRNSNHHRQCWKSMYEFELCLEPETDDGGYADMILDAIPPDQGNGTVFAAPAHSHAFLDNTQWDEVTVIEHDHDQMDVVTKCTHEFEARICLERGSTFIITVFIQIQQESPL